MFQRLREILHPFSVIAQELRLLRELYELELSERKPPIIRRTEKPRESDTEVTYMGDESEKKRRASVLRGLMDNGQLEEEEDDVFDARTTASGQSGEDYYPEVP